MSTKAKHPRVQAFAPVPLRTRRNGWTPAKQAAFLAQLALTGNVRLAAKRVGMSRETAYRLRTKPGAESFADAWDRLTGRFSGRARKVTYAGRWQRAMHGLLKPIIYRGRHVATVEKVDISAIIGLNGIAMRAERQALLREKLRRVSHSVQREPAMACDRASEGGRAMLALQSGERP